MRTSAGFAIVLVALTVIVGLSMSSATVEQERLLTEFTSQTQQQVHSSAEALSRLDSVHQDMRMLADLVERSRQERQLDPPTERRVWESAFRALAVVVLPYRIIALIDGDGALEVLGDRSHREPRHRRSGPGGRREAGEDHRRQQGRDRGRARPRRRPLFPDLRDARVGRRRDRRRQRRSPVAPLCRVAAAPRHPTVRDRSIRRRLVRMRELRRLSGCGSRSGSELHRPGGQLADTPRRSAG